MSYIAKRNANKHLEYAGLWSRGNLPSENQYRILCHLNSPGEPRLYLQFEGGYTSYDVFIHCSLSNSKVLAGWTCSVDPRPFLDKNWVTEDRRWRGRTARSIRVYKINDCGREAIVQVDIHRAFRATIERVIPTMLRQHRKRVGIADVVAPASLRQHSRKPKLVIK